MDDDIEAVLAHLEERILLAAARGYESNEKFYVSTRDRVTNILVEDGVLGFVGKNRQEERRAVDRLCEQGLLRPEGRWRYAPTEEGLRRARGASEASDDRPAGLS